MSSSPINATPVIIIGAARSGTNMLRDVLTSLDGIETWPCDEINYIWRHGNRSFESDELTSVNARDKVVSFIRLQFANCVSNSALSKISRDRRILIEKTCANSLRVPFVHSVIPEAKYIHIVRDGRDVVASAMKRWKAPLDLTYLMAKARYVPKSDLLFYASRYLFNRLSKLFNAESSLAVWGPKFIGMQDLSKNSTLPKLCANQWVRSVTLATEALASMPSSKVHSLRYEDFVKDPIRHVQKILDFLSVEYSTEDVIRVCSIVRTNSIGKSSASTEIDHAEVEALMKESLESHGYL